MVCVRCKRSVHYRCTQLPPYQIQLFLDKQKSTHYKYVCPNCVEVKKEITELVPVTTRTLPSLRREVDKLRRELDACNGLLKQNELDRKLMDDQKSELENLKNKLSTDPGLHTFEYVEQQIEEKLESFKLMIEETIKTECKALSEKSYADVAKSGTFVNFQDP